jgi:hypothetical protein
MPTTAEAAGRQVNRLYDSGSDLVEAAIRLRESARNRDTVPAHPAVLGCIELALVELDHAVEAIREAAGAGLVGRGIENLEIALQDAAAAAAAARSLSARSVSGRR